MELDELRKELRQIDRRILELVTRRQELSLQIGSAKREQRRPTRDFEQEKAVLELGRGLAMELGLSPDLTEKLLVLLIRSSLTAQERDKVAAEGTGSGKRALIIGGSGKMGGWFVRFLGSQGFDASIADPALGPADVARVDDWGETPLDHDVIVVAAPLGASNGILRELAARRPTGLVFDIGSLKSPLRSGLKALVDAGVKATSVHPMFGPDTELLSGTHVVFVDLGNARATEEAEELFASTMTRRVHMDLESHDRVIAWVLGLSHALNIAFFTAMAESGEAAPRLAELSSTTFEAQLSVARSVAGDNPHLYFEIQTLNDYGTESLSALLYAVEKVRSVIRAGDRRGFVRIMEMGKQYLAGRE